MVNRLFLTSLAFLVLTGLGSPSSAQGARTLESLTTTFEKRLFAVTIDREEVELKTLGHYKSGLQKLIKQIQSKGDLEGVVAAKKELTRLDSDPTIPPAGDDEQILPGIVKARSTVHEWRLKQMVAVDEKELKLQELFAKLLDPLKKDLTRTGKVEEALKVDAVLKTTLDRVAKLRAGLPNRSTIGQRAGGDLPADLRRGLVLYLPFDKVSGGKAEDLSELKHEAKLDGKARWTREGRNGGGLSVGSGAAVVIPHHESLSCSHDLSLACWVRFDKPVAEMGGYPSLFTKNDWDAKQGYHLLFNQNAKGMLEHRIIHGNWFTPIGWPDSRELKTDQWYHLAMTMKGWTIEIYSNGEPVHKGKISQATVPSKKDLFIGPGILGKMDEVLVYDRALTAREVKRIFEHQNKE